MEQTFEQKIEFYNAMHRIDPDFSDIINACKTLCFASKYDFTDILTNEQANELKNLVEVYISNFNIYKKKVIEQLLNEIKNGNRNNK